MSFITLCKQEWIKFQSRRSLIFLIICVLINLGMVMLCLGLLHMLPKEGVLVLTPELVQRLNPFSYLLTTFSSLLTVIASLFFIMQYGDEYKYGLVRKNVVDGMGRSDIFNGKMIFLFGSYLAWTIILVLTFLVVAAFQFGDDFGMIVSSMKWEQILKYYLHIIFYGAFSFFLVSVTRSAIISISIFIALRLVGEMLIRYAFSYYELDQVNDYLPFTLADVVCSSNTISNSELIAYLFYLCGFIGIGQWVLYKKDL